MEQKTFSELKPKIQKAIEKRLDENPIDGENGFILIDGFIMKTIQPKLSGSVVIGGPSVPMVGIVGKTTGRVYLFALKVLLPDIEI